ncbi:MAG: hypothetical protein ACM3X5_06705 [Bacillota bacterium]
MANISAADQAGNALPPSDWLFVVGTAQSDIEVLAIARDFIATWSALEVSRLPPSCHPGRIACTDDVSEFAYRLTRAHLAFTGSITDWLLLERMMNFFVQAGTRIGELHALARGGTGILHFGSGRADA